MDKTKIIHCTACGYTGAAADFDQHPNGSGVWCPDCDAFIWHNPKNNNQHIGLLLEQSVPGTRSTTAAVLKLNKRLSPLRYPGGKSKLIDCLFANVQTSKCDTFVEVFAGGASFGLALLDAGIVKNLVLNDKDPYLINFWSQVIHNPDGLIKRLSTISPTHADYDQAKAFLSEGGSHDPLDAAWAYLLLNRLSYSGIQKAGCQGGKDGSTEALLARYNPKAIIKRITRIAELHGQITLLNQDFTETIENYYWNDKATLFVDPPYFGKGKALYSHYFTDQDHRALSELLQSLTLEFPGCADILITYDNAPFIEDLYWSMDPKYIARKYSI